RACVTADGGPPARQNGISRRSTTPGQVRVTGRLIGSSVFPEGVTKKGTTLPLLTRPDAWPSVDSNPVMTALRRHLAPDHPPELVLGPWAAVTRRSGAIDLALADSDRVPPVRPTRMAISQPMAGERAAGKPGGPRIAPDAASGTALGPG